MAKTGKVLMVSELTDGYGMKDIGGTFHLKSFRKFLLEVLSSNTKIFETSLTIYPNFK